MLCLDTNIVIFAMNKRKPWIGERLREELKSGASSILIPTFVLFELVYGIAKSANPIQSLAVLNAFLTVGFEHPEFDADDAREAGDIRAHLEKRGIPIGPYDYLIAAQARRRSAALVTLNRREFDRVPGLIVTDWGGAEG